MWSLLSLNQDQAEKQWWALRFGPGASGFIMDSALLEQHYHAAEPTSQAYQSFLLVANKHDATVQCLANVLNRYAAGTQRPFRRAVLSPLPKTCPVTSHVSCHVVLCSCNAAWP